MSVDPEIVRHEPKEKRCPSCQAVLNVRNTRCRTIVTSNGEQRVTEVTRYCPKHPEEAFRPSVRLTSPKSPYGFDVLADVGKLRFLEHKQIGEIHDYFKMRGIDIPERTIQNLCQRFLLYVVAVHLESYPRIAGLIGQNGGYVLHVDASTTKGSPLLLLLKDSWSGIRLLAASITTESAEEVKPHLETIQENFGNPVAAVRDMGSGIENALVEVFPDVYILTCHYHFLKAVGLRLFDKIYPRFQRRVDKTGIKKKLRKLRKRFQRRKRTEERDKALELLEYVMAHRKDGNGIAYPFSLPTVDFYKRCEKVRPEVRTGILGRAKLNKCSPCLSRLEDALNLLKPPPAVRGRIHSECQKLEARWQWFEQIRKALRYRNGPIPLNTKGFLSNTELEKGRKMIDNLQTKMNDFIKHGDSKGDRTLKRVLRGISEMLTERRDELLAPNIAIEINGIQKVKQLPRTNNTLEQDFRSLRRHSRRIRGDADIERTVQRDGVGLAIVKNIENKNYLRHIYGHLNQIPSQFAKVSPNSLQQAKALFQTTENPEHTRNA